MPRPPAAEIAKQQLEAAQTVPKMSHGEERKARERLEETTSGPGGSAYLFAGPWAAARCGDVPALKEMKKRGDPLDAADSTGLRPLHLACWAGRLHAAEYLVSEGADVHAVTPSRQNILMLAVGKGHRQVMRWLMATQDVDPLARDNMGGNSVDVARNGGHHQIHTELKAALLLKSIDESGDGEISHDEFFDSIRGDGSLGDFTIKIKGMGGRKVNSFSDEELELLFAHFDADNSGVINLNEFLDGLTMLERKPPPWLCQAGEHA